jgi:hypothetical protein
MCSDFKCGRVGTTAIDRSGRPTRASTPQNEVRVAAALFDIRQATVTELDHDLGLSRGTTIRIIQWFGFHKLCARYTFTLAFGDAILTNLS